MPVMVIGMAAVSNFCSHFGQQVNAGSRVSHHRCATAADVNVEVR